MNIEKYQQIKKNFTVGIICFVAGVVCAVVAHFLAQELDLANLLYYDVSEIRVWIFGICTVAGFVLMGIPFVKLNFVKKLFNLVLYMITHNKDRLDFISKTDADSIIEVRQGEDGTTEFSEEKSAFIVVLESIVGIILLVAGGVLLYALGVVLSLFLLIGQLIYLLINKSKQQ